MVDLDVLTRAGVPETLAPRTLQALRSLDLIAEDGRLTEVLEGLRLAPEVEYKQRMGDWLRSAYADVLTYVNPETAGEGELRDAFRTYKPIGQQTRMVSLFQGLFTAAGIVPERQRQIAPRTSASGAASATKSRSLGQAKSRSGSDSKSRSSSGGLPTPDSNQRMQNSAMPPAIAGLLASLPANGRWTQAQRDKFMTAFPVMLDFAFEIVSEADLASAETNTAFDL